MDSFWEAAAAFASISQVAGIIIGALIAAVLFGAAAGFLPEAAQKKNGFQASIGSSGPVIVQTGSGIQINNIGSPPQPSARQSIPSRIVVTRFSLEPRNRQDANSPLDWRIYMKNRGGVGYAPHLVLSAGLPQQVLSVAEISESMATAVASAKPSPPYNGQQIEADQEVWVPVNGLPADPTAWKDIREG
jgi:hypothetical protein